MGKDVRSSSEVTAAIKHGVTLLKFYSDTCPPCIALKPAVEAMERQFARVTFLHVNNQRCPEVFGEFGVRAMPTVIIFAKGAEVARIKGNDPNGIRNALMKVASPGGGQEKVRIVGGRVVRSSEAPQVSSGGRTLGGSRSPPKHGDKERRGDMREPTRMRLAPRRDPRDSHLVTMALPLPMCTVKVPYAIILAVFIALCVASSVPPVVLAILTLGLVAFVDSLQDLMPKWFEQHRAPGTARHRH